MFSKKRTIFPCKYTKLFLPGVAETHERVAQRLLSLCKTNGGLYIKLGQGIASMNHVLPPQYNQAFSVLHDQVVTDYVRDTIYHSA